MPNDFVEIRRKWGTEETRKYGTLPQPPASMWPDGPGLSVHFFQLVVCFFQLMLVLNQGPLSDLLLPPLPAHLAGSSLPAGGSNPNPCHCSHFWSVCQPVSHLQPPPLFQPLPGCVQLQVLLPWLLSQSLALLGEQNSISNG